MKFYLTVAVLIVVPWCLKAQTPITDVIFEYASSSSLSYSLASKTYNFGNAAQGSQNIQRAVGLVMPGQTFYYNSYVSGQVKLRRVNNSAATGKRTLVWMESVETSTTYNIAPPYQDEMEIFLDGRNINQGTDNLFGNQGDGSGNNNNIERVDWIAAGGLQATNVSQAGFAILERGGDNQHDPFCIAPVLSIDAFGNPTQYGKILRITPANYGNITSSTIGYSILRKEEVDARLTRITSGSQNRGGVFISFKDLNLVANQTIYGYSLFSNDLPLSATPSNLVNFTDPFFFPNNTSSNTGDGGIDLIAITGIFNTVATTIVLPVRLLSFTTVQQAGEVALQWQIAGGEDVKQVEVERSFDATVWSKLASLGSWQHFFTDLSPGGKKAFYRLHVVSRDGTGFYSEIKSTEAPVVALPSLKARLKDRVLQLWLRQEEAQPVQLVVYDMLGNAVWHTSVMGNAGEMNLQFFFLPSCPAAILEVRTKKGVLRQKLIAQ